MDYRGRQLGQRPHPRSTVQSPVPQDLCEGIEKYLASGIIRGIGPVYVDWADGEPDEAFFSIPPDWRAEGCYSTFAAVP